MRTLRLAVIALVATFLLAACGGTSPATGPGAATSAARTAVPAAPTTAPAAPTTVPGAPTTAPGLPTTAPVTGDVDLCSLLTAADLSAAIGKTYDAGVLQDFVGCTWNTDGQTTNTGDLVILSMQPNDLGTIKAAFGLGGSDATVNGHPAFWNPSEGLTSMWVDIGGGNLLVLSFPQSNDLDPSYQAIAQHLAELAVSKM